jgi:hypothetical protein
MVNIDDFLTGTEQADLSHGEGELGSLEQDIEEDLVEEDKRWGRYGSHFFPASLAWADMRAVAIV